MLDRSGGSQRCKQQQPQKGQASVASVHKVGRDARDQSNSGQVAPALGSIRKGIGPPQAP